MNRRVHLNIGKIGEVLVSELKFDKVGLGVMKKRQEVVKF